MIAFLVVAPHDISNQLINDIETYLDPSASLLVGLETANGVHKQTNGEHYHVVTEMTDKQYDTFRKTILVNKMKLSGQATNGNSRQYGKLKNIRDQTKILQYTCKDKHIYYRNIDLQTIQDAINNSYKKEDRKDFIQQIMDYLGEKDYTNSGIEDLDITKIEINIIKYYIETKQQKPISKSTLRSLTTRYLMYHEPHAKINDIYCYIQQK